MSIVFEEDWNKYPSAIADTKTRNKTFIDMAILYKSIGIKNYYFHLALLQPQLQGIDPFDEDNLTLEQKAMILWECDNNIWYFLRECIRVKGAGDTPEESMYIADRAQIGATWLLMACIDYIRIQPRQTGKSYGTNCNTLWLNYMHYEDTTLNLITKDEKLRQSNIKSFKDIRDEWPSYINRHSKKDDNNQVSLSCIERNNKLFTHVAQNSEKNANNLGRGLTSPYLHFDEPPFIAFIEKTMVGALGSTGDARKRAKRRGKVFCNVFTTTAGDIDDRDGKVIYRMWKEAAVWNDKFLDSKNRDDLIKIITTNMTGIAVTVNMTMSHRQLGLSDEWLADKIAVARGEGSDIDKDYMNLWTGGSQGSIIPRHLSEIVSKSIIAPIHTDISAQMYLFNWYETYNPEATYVFTIDTSNAIGRDDIGVTLINAATGNTAAAANFNTTNLHDFANWVAEFLVQYKNATLIIENAFNAQVIIDIVYLKLLAHGEDPFRRMYNTLVQNKEERRTEYQDMVQNRNKGRAVVDRYRQDFGFRTTPETRKLLYKNVLINALTDSGAGVRDSKLASQMLGLVVKNQRVDHGSGGHDDMVISYLMGQWLLRFGHNLSFYGIDHNRVLSSVSSKDYDDATVAEVRVHDKHVRSMAEIDEVYELLKKSPSQFEIFKLEAKLRVLMSRLDKNKSTVKSYDAMVEEAARLRRNNARSRR